MARFRTVKRRNHSLFIVTRSVTMVGHIHIQFVPIHVRLIHERSARSVGSAQSPFGQALFWYLFSGNFCQQILKTNKLFFYWTYSPLTNTLLWLLCFLWAWKTRIILGRKLSWVRVVCFWVLLGEGPPYISGEGPPIYRERAPLILSIGCHVHRYS